MKDAARAVRMQNQEDPVRMDVTDEENMMEITETEQDKEVQLTEMGGRQRVFGLNDLTRAQATDDTKAASMETAKLKGFL